MPRNSSIELASVNGTFKFAFVRVSYNASLYNEKPVPFASY